MFKSLLDFWREKDFLKQVLEDFKEILNDAEHMFGLVHAGLVLNKSEPDLKEKIYAIDKRVNETERNIRKKIVEHLLVQPSVDMPMSLLLMSVVKDAERLGDYSKNLFEVKELLKKPINREMYVDIFDNIDGKLIDLFKQTKKAFIDSDENEAKQTWQNERSIVKSCDEIIKKLVKSNLSVNESVCFALIARYYKRIAAHLTNISTSVILPISDLDYYDEKRIEE